MLVLIGSSASGKTEIAKILIKQFNFQKMITYTTRKPRMNEVNGVDYHFVSVDEFIQLEQHNEFVETTYYNDHFYGTRFQDVNQQKVLIVDINGANNIYEKLGSKIVIFYLYASEETRIKRMKERQDDTLDIIQRINKDKIHFNQALLKHIDAQINTEYHTLQELAEHINTLYQTIISRK